MALSQENEAVQVAVQVQSSWNKTRPSTDLWNGDPHEGFRRDELREAENPILHLTPVVIFQKSVDEWLTYAVGFASQRNQ